MRENYINWDEYFMLVSMVSGLRSKDPSTQVGACIVSPDNKIIGVGYNGLPTGCNDSEYPWDVREGNMEDTKYPYVCHAELNAILNTTVNPKGAKIYVSLFPCHECAKAIIQSGIKEVVYLSDKYADTPSVKVSKRMLEDAGVKMRQLTLSLDKLQDRVIGSIQELRDTKSVIEPPKEFPLDPTAYSELFKEDSNSILPARCFIGYIGNLPSILHEGEYYFDGNTQTLKLIVAHTTFYAEFQEGSLWTLEKNSRQCKEFPRFFVLNNLRKMENKIDVIIVETEEDLLQMIELLKRKGLYTSRYPVIIRITEKLQQHAAYVKWFLYYIYDKMAHQIFVKGKNYGNIFKNPYLLDGIENNTDPKVLGVFNIIDLNKGDE